MEISGIIVKSVGGLYTVKAGDELHSCRARGKFRNQDIKPMVGDWVSIKPDLSDVGWIADIKDRKNFLSRPAVSNIDTLVIVSALSVPRPAPIVIDRLAAYARHNNINPAVVFNKNDEAGGSGYLGIYKKASMPAFAVSAATGDGLDNLAGFLTDKISAFCGNSGVGKTSLLNILCPGLALPTGDVSVKLGRGRHITRHVELIPLPVGGYVADTPGFSSFASADSRITAQNLQYCFDEFEPFVTKCKFLSCSHTCEKGCAVIEAVQADIISKSRWDSYVVMYNELKDIREWTQDARSKKPDARRKT